MKVRFSIWSVVAVALISVVMLSGDQAMASNMGFKMNRVIVALGGNPVGQNRVALPYKNPYQSANDICSALGLAAVSAGSTGVVRQINATTGVTSVCNCYLGAASCGTAAFPLTQRVGLRVTNPASAGGILVGSHAGNPPGSITLIGGVGLVNPVGQNDFSVPYHTTAVTTNDLCVDLGISTVTHPLVKVTQLNAVTGVSCIGNCAVNNCSLVLGESVVINGLNSNINVAAGHPAHF